MAGVLRTRGAFYMRGLKPLCVIKIEDYPVRKRSGLKTFLLTVGTVTAGLCVSYVAVGLEYGVTFLLFAVLVTIGAILTLGVSR
jgi:hypothetical protein